MQRHYNDCEATPQSQRRRDGDFPYSSRLQLCVPGFQFSWVQKQMTYFLPVLIYFSPFLISHFFLSSFILRFLPIFRLFLTSFLYRFLLFLFSFPWVYYMRCNCLRNKSRVVLTDDEAMNNKYVPWSTKSWHSHLESTLNNRRWSTMNIVLNILNKNNHCYRISIILSFYY